MRARLKQFPIPSKLNGDWFRKRMVTKSERTGKLLSPKTIKAEVVIAKQVLKWADMDASSLDKGKLKLKPVPLTTVTVNDLYTREELSAIFASCLHPRDKAALEVLYETGVRAGELLSITWENVSFGENGGLTTIFVTGKTGSRETYIQSANHSLKAWLATHPTGSGPIWVKLRRPFKPLTSRQLYNVAKQALDRAGITGKRKILHMFRHTRVSEDINSGIQNLQLCHLYGWKPNSGMPAVYGHLATSDIVNEVKAKRYGQDTEVEKPKPLLGTSICPDCSTENAQDARICSKCDLPLSNDAILQALHRQDRFKELEEKVERLMRFQDTIGEAVRINVGTKNKPKYIEAYRVKKPKKKQKT